MNHSSPETLDPHWKSLCKVGGFAALIIAALIPVQAVFFIVWPPPGTVIGYFTRYQNS